MEVFSTAARARVRDYLQSHDVTAGKGSGQPIVDCLLNLFPPPTATTAERAQRQAGASGTVDPRIKSDKWVLASDLSKSQVIRDIVKTTLREHEQYYGPHESTLLYTVEEAFFAECDALNVPDGARVNVMCRFLCGDALKHFSSVINPIETSAKNALRMLDEHYNTHAHQRSNKDECNRLSFSFMSLYNPKNTDAEILKLLYNLAQDLKALLGPP